MIKKPTSNRELKRSRFEKGTNERDLYAAQCIKVSMPTDTLRPAEIKKIPPNTDTKYIFLWNKERPG